MATNRIAVALLAAALAAPHALAAPSEYVPGEVLVRFRDDAPPWRRHAALAARAHAALSEPHPGWTHVRLRPGESVEEALAGYAGDPQVEYAQPNFVYRASALPNDTHFGQLWGLRNTGQYIQSTYVQPGGALYDTTYQTNTNPGVPGSDIHVEPAWSVTTDCSGTVVAVLDSGVNYLHQDLAANMWDGGPDHPNHGTDFVGTGDNDPMDLAGHGTHVAATIAAVGNDARGVVGVCWTARIMAVRALDALGMGSTATITAGINFAVAHGAKIINMSLGTGSTPDVAFAAAIDGALTNDVLLVVAAGNDGLNNDVSGNETYPCNSTQPNVLCVAALDQEYGLALFSNYGRTSVDVGAPGTNILSSWAGTNTRSSESLGPSLTGWSRTSTTIGSGGGWGYAFDATYGVPALVDPTSFLSNERYLAGTDDRVWRQVSFSGAVAATIEFAISVDLAPDDWLRLACTTTGGDPFSTGPVVAGVKGEHTNRALYWWGADVSACAGASNASVGFQLQSAPGSARDYGAEIGLISFERLFFNTTSYNTINGTSMATPMVTGVAALLRSYNPAYTAADTKSAIVQAGRPVASLSGKTTSGKAVDAMASLAYLNAPTGLAFVVH